MQGYEDDGDKPAIGEGPDCAEQESCWGQPLKARQQRCPSFVHVELLWSEQSKADTNHECDQQKCRQGERSGMMRSGALVGSDIR